MAYHKKRCHCHSNGCPAQIWIQKPGRNPSVRKSIEFLGVAVDPHSGSHAILNARAWEKIDYTFCKSKDNAPCRLSAEEDAGQNKLSARIDSGTQYSSDISRGFESQQYLPSGLGFVHPHFVIPVLYHIALLSAK